MPVRMWQSPQPRTPFAPSWKVPLFIERLDAPETNAEIRRLILEKEVELKNEIEPIAIAGIDKGTTALWHGFNVFAWQEPAMRSFQDFVRQSYRSFMQKLGLRPPRTWVQGWVNVLRKGERFSPHCHDQLPTSYLSGNYCVAAEGTSTIYFPPYSYFVKGELNEEHGFAVKNEPGTLTLFPSMIYHATSLYEGETERISLAFDIHVEDRDALGKDGDKGLHVPFDDPAAWSCQGRSAGVGPGPVAAKR